MLRSLARPDDCFSSGAPVDWYSLSCQLRMDVRNHSPVCQGKEGFRQNPRTSPGKFIIMHYVYYYGYAYRDRRLTINFELWVEIFCVPACFHMTIPKPCLSVPRENKSPQLRRYQSNISNWYINGKVYLHYCDEKVEYVLHVTVLVLCLVFK